MKLSFVCLLALLLANLDSRAQQASYIKPIAIGDTVPDFVVTNLINYAGSSARLSDWKGKWVILDFWNRYCSSCIAALPKLQKVQQKLGDRGMVISITDITDRATLDKLMGKYPEVKVPVAMGAQSWAGYFPHEIVSHVVWIGPDGKVRAFTGTDYLSDSSVEEALHGTTKSWPVKQDVAGFSIRKPLLTWQPETALPAFLYYSALTAHIPGINPASGVSIWDSVTHTRSMSFYNYALPDLCKLAYTYELPLSGTRWELKVSDSSRFIRPAKRRWGEWSRDNTYCYTLRLPDTTPEDRFAAMLRDDLVHWLKVLGVTVLRNPADANTFNYTIQSINQ